MSGKRFGIPAIGPEVLHARLGTAMHDERDRIALARLETERLDDVAIDGLIVPTFEAELLEVADPSRTQQLLVDLRQAPRRAALQ